MGRSVRVDFSKMPAYTRPDQYRIRKYVREQGYSEHYSGIEDIEYEETHELDELFGFDGWGENRNTFW